VVASVLLGFGTVAGWTLYKRRLHGDEWEREAALAAALDEVLADTLDDLRAERDPRRAVIRTYARMEHTFAAYGVAREQAEAPLEYVERVLDRLRVSSFATKQLTQLFARARFSPHEIDTGMKDEAIEALAGLRAELEYKPEAA
jgi:predicted negative regulator of RcsB-dependent stress response